MVDRRTFLAGSIGVIAGLSLSVATADEALADLEVIDCHTHFYDPTRSQGVPWPGKGTSLYRTVLPKHLKELKQFRRLTGTVIVEASPSLEDNQWLLDLARDEPFIVGIVGNLTPATPLFAKHLNRFAANSLFRSIRVSSKLVEELVAKNALDDFKLMVDLDTSLDVNGGPETPAIIARLAAKVPQLRIILNHIGNVRITTDAPPLAWQQGIREAAQQANVYCKVSALVEGASRDGQKAPADLAYYKPYIDVVWHAFGDQRVIYGSNWPVSENAADYETLQRIVMEYATTRGAVALQQFCSLNAHAAYKWVKR